EQDSIYELNDIPDTYDVILNNDSVWKHYHLKGSILPEQGWKIHVTSSLEDSKNVLDKVARLCLDKKIEFKLLKNKD
ncbi:hypothetical protein, partial [Bacillus velezensis]|uniref:class III lanthionine synthetase LanKC N-terminal domain-containing protein n=1 Tax=Bacillus velezensis TaxID=492670 RepID=UPI0020BFAA77